MTDPTPDPRTPDQPAAPDAQPAAQEAQPAAPAAKPKKPQGPIRWGMIIGILVLWGGTGLALYLLRDRIIHAGVVRGGRSTFRSAVTLDEASSGLSPAATKVALKGLQVPDRHDLSRNLIQAEALELEVGPLALLEGRIHVPHARASGVKLNEPRPTPAEPLVDDEPPAVPEDELPTPDEGSLLDALAVGTRPWSEVLEALGLETVAYAKGLPARIEQREREWREKLAAHQQELAALQARAKELQPRVAELAGQIQAEWSAALTEKRQKIDQLEQALKKDPQAAGKNPATDIPARVQQELASLDELKAREEQRAAGLRAELKQLQEDAARLKAALERLEKDARAGQAQLEAEVAKARTAAEHDRDKIRRWVDPSGEGAEELLQILVGPRVARQVTAGRKWVALLWRFIPPRGEKVPPPTPREGIDVVFPPHPGHEQAARDALARLLIEDLELEGQLTLDEQRLRLEGHLLNVSDAPRLVGREVGFDLACTLGEGAEAQGLKVQGGLMPESEHTRLQVSCAGVPVEGLVLREGEAAPQDLFPRRIESARVDLQLKIESSPQAFALHSDVHLRELTFSPVPGGGDLPAAALAARSVLSGVKELHLEIGVTLPREGKPRFEVRDLTQPGVLAAMQDAVGQAVKEEVAKVTASYEAQLEKTLAEEGDQAQAALNAATSGFDKSLGGVRGELDKVAPASAKPLDEALAGGDQAKKKLAEEAVPRLLKAAGQGGLKLPEVPKLPFGKD